MEGLNDLGWMFFVIFCLYRFFGLGNVDMLAFFIERVFIDYKIREILMNLRGC